MNGRNAFYNLSLRRNSWHVNFACRRVSHLGAPPTPECDAKFLVEALTFVSSSMFSLPTFFCLSLHHLIPIPLAMLLFPRSPIPSLPLLHLFAPLRSSPPLRPFILFQANKLRQRKSLPILVFINTSCKTYLKIVRLCNSLASMP